MSSCLVFLWLVGGVYLVCELRTGQCAQHSLNVVSNNGEAESQSVSCSCCLCMYICCCYWYFNCKQFCVQSVMYTMNTWDHMVCFGDGVRCKWVVVVGTVRRKLLKYISLSCICRILVLKDQQVILLCVVICKSEFSRKLFLFFNF